MRDLFQHSNNRIGSAAPSNIELLKQVVNQKKVLYYSGWAKYDDCLGNLRLIPDNTSINALKDDFIQMKKNSMFWEEPTTFKDILAELSNLETTINKLFGTTK